MARSGYTDLFDDFFGNGSGAGKTAEKAGAKASVDEVSRQVREMQDFLQKKTAELTREMANDGLLDPAVQPQQTAAVVQNAEQGSWEGISEKLAAQLVGQEELLQSLVRAFRRPTLLPPQGENARNVIYLYGGNGSGRHSALRMVAAELAARGLLQSPQIAQMQLSLYPGPAQEKLFLQDLYSAISAPGQIIAFDGWAECAPSCRAALSALVQKGAAPLNSRYLLQKGILVESGTALAGGTVSQLTPKGKYLVFFGTQKPEKLASAFGAGFAEHIGDSCAAAAYTPETLQTIAAGELNRLAQNCRSRLELELSADAALRDWLAGVYTKAEGVAAIVRQAERLYRALAEYKLTRSPAAGAKITLRAEQQGEAVLEAQGETIAITSLLPGVFAAERAQAEAELDAVVGLAPVKEYVRALADNVAAQSRRRAAGLPVAMPNMHMIFAGNPGTGKTTIARIVAHYLKAIGVLRGGQLVEVSRADLVGRYVGHTAPLTNSVIQSALGGVLFIDEAYSLFRGREDSFGLEAIDALVKGIEDHREDLVVVLAGYSREMDQFLTANSGLASRFPNRIEFPDYTADELIRITESIAKGKGYRLDAACLLPLHAYYEQQQAQNAAAAGNGRMARNLLEKAILNQSRRLIADPNAALDELQPSDFELE